MYEIKYTLKDNSECFVGGYNSLNQALDVARSHKDKCNAIKILYTTYSGDSVELELKDAEIKNDVNNFVGSKRLKFA